MKWVWNLGACISLVRRGLLLEKWLGHTLVLVNSHFRVVVTVGIVVLGVGDGVFLWVKWLSWVSSKAVMSNTFLYFLLSLTDVLWVIIGMDF